MATKDMTEAPMKDPARDKLSEAALVGAAEGPSPAMGPGAARGASPTANATLTETAATRRAKESFFMSMMIEK